jgi:hypothetical protein
VLAQVSCFFEQVPASLEKEPLLGVQERGVAGKDIEERGVETVDFLEEPAPFSVASVRLSTPRIKMGAPVPPRLWNLLYAIGSAGKVLPKSRQVRGLRISAAYTDHRDVVCRIARFPVKDSWSRRFHLRWMLAGQVWDFGVFNLGFEQRCEPWTSLLHQMTGQLLDRDALKEQG